METALIIAGIVALVAFVGVCIVAISTLRRVSDIMLDVSAAVDETKRLSAELNRNLPQTFATLNATSSQLTTTLKNVDVQLESLGEGIGQFKQIGSRINGLEAKLQDKVEGPLMQAASVVAGISKAISTFANGVSKR